MTVNQTLKEIDFLHKRVLFLSSQPQDADGMLIREDDRGEARVLRELVEEYENILKRKGIA